MVIAWYVRPKVAESVATADSKTLAGVYMPQINETMYDSQAVNNPKTMKLAGKERVNLPKTE